MNSRLQDQVADFCRQHWHGDAEKFFLALGKRGWLAADWPRDRGGPGWGRSEQLTFVQTLASFHCPLPPDSLTLGASMLLVMPYSDATQMALDGIASRPLDWQMEHDGTIDRLVLRNPNLEIVLAESGEATKRISEHGSTLWHLYEWMSGIEHIVSMADYWQEGMTDELAEMQVELDAAIAMFQNDAHLADRQLSLNASKVRLPIFSTLFQSLGYYALLDPHPDLSANEPIPFPEERLYLAQLRRLIARDEMLQLDKIYEEITTDE